MSIGLVFDKNTLKIGFEYVYIFQQYGITWDESFYRQCNINFEKRWSSFFIEREKRREENLFNKLNPENKNFALIHDTGSDGISRVKEELIDKIAKLMANPAKMQEMRENALKEIKKHFDHIIWSQKIYENEIDHNKYLEYIELRKKVYQYHIDQKIIKKENI